MSFPKGVYRHWECTCGHQWLALVKFSSPSASMTGEATVWCPKCHQRPWYGSKHLRIEHEGRPIREFPR